MMPGHLKLMEFKNLNKVKIRYALIKSNHNGIVYFKWQYMLMKLHDLL